MSAIALACVLATCGAPSAMIVSVSQSSVAQGMTVPVTLETQNCAPPFDVGSGTYATDMFATVHLGASISAQATRTGAESFGFVVPASAPAGVYPLTLSLSGGRMAAFAGTFTIAAADLEITTLTSPRTVVSAGENGLDLEVTLVNHSACNISGVIITPTFSRNGAPGTVDFTITPHDPVYVDAMQTYVAPIFVSLSPAAVQGPVRVTVAASGGMRSGTGCTGVPVVSDSSQGLTWVVVGSGEELLDVTDVAASMTTVAQGATFVLQGHVRSNGPLPVTVTGVDVQPDRGEIAGTSSTTVSPARLTQAASAAYSVTVTAPTGVEVAGDLELRVVARGRLDDGTIVTSPPSGVYAHVTVH